MVMAREKIEGEVSGEVYQGGFPTGLLSPVSMHHGEGREGQI